MKVFNNDKNMSLTKKQLLAIITTFAIAMSGSTLAGCKKAEGTTVTTSTATETSETIPTPTPVVISMDSICAEMAKKFYDENKDFFVNQYGENREYAEKDIKNALLVLSNSSETVTNEDLRNALYALDNMFMPTNVIQAAGNYMTNEPIEKFERVPSLGKFIQDKQAQQVINDNTAIINQFIDAMNNGTDEEKANARLLVLQRIATVEQDLDEYYYFGELSNGDELALNMSMKGLTNLAGSLVKNGVLNFTDKNGVDQTMFLIADTRGAAILNTFRFAEEDNAPFDTKEIDGVTVNGRYIEYLGPNGFVREFVTQAEKNTIEDTLVITKYDESIKGLENEFSRISTEYYELNKNCDTKTLTK